MGLYCTHEMVASLKQDRRSLGARQGETILLKRQRWSERNGISRTCHVKRSLDSLRSWSGCFVHEAGCRMRLSVRRWRRVRFSVRRLDVCPGEEKHALRKSAFYNRYVTKKRILQPACHAKAHSAASVSRKSAFCMKFSRKGALWDLQNRQNALLREAVGAECGFS